MTPGAALPRPARLAAAACVLLLPLAGCGSIGSAAGAVAGIASSAGTANPLVGTAVALGTKAAVDALVLYISRSRQHDEQDAIAGAAGQLAVGQSVPWRIHHLVPLGDEHGTVMVADVVDNPLADCKEVVFTVQAASQQAHYVTTECRDQGKWQWALAEPATSRWGALQ